MDNKLPLHPIIIENITHTNDYRDALENISHILALLEHLDLSEGLDKRAEFGWFMILQMLGESARYLNKALEGDKLAKADCA